MAEVQRSILRTSTCTVCAIAQGESYKPDIMKIGVNRYMEADSTSVKLCEVHLARLVQLIGVGQDE